MGRLDGKVCVITGAGGGMGATRRSFSPRRVQRSRRRTSTARRRRRRDEVGGLGVQVDVSDAESVQAMYRSAAARFGGIDVLYNNAGISPADDDSILETDLDAWERVQAVNTAASSSAASTASPICSSAAAAP